MITVVSPRWQTRSRDHVIAQMDMPVDEPAGLVFVQDTIEALEASVRGVGAIVEAVGRGVGQQQVDATRPVSLELQPGGPPLHGAFRVLVGVLAVVPQASAQPHDAQPALDIDIVVDAGAAARFGVLIAAVMIAVDIIQEV